MKGLARHEAISIPCHTRLSEPNARFGSEADISLGHITARSTPADTPKAARIDLVALRVGDLAREGGLGARAQIIQRKTGRTVQFELTEQTRRAIMDWIIRRGLTREDYLFPSRRQPLAHLSTRQYARMVKRWVASAGLPPSDYGTHSMRRTKPTLIYRRTHNLRAIQLLLGHTKLESTVRYLGIEVEDALALSEETEV